MAQGEYGVVSDPPQKDPLIECRLATANEDRSPTGGVCELRNVSQVPFELEWWTDPFQYLDLCVTNDRGEIVSEAYYGQFAPSRTRRVLVLGPCETYRRNVFFFRYVSPSKLRPGRYFVEAIYSYRSITARSARLEIVLTESDLRGLSP